MAHWQETAVRGSRKVYQLGRAMLQNRLALVLAIGVAAGGAWIFVELADEVFEGETHAFDEAVLLAMRNADDTTDPIGPPVVEELARDITAIGGFGVQMLVTMAVAGALVLQRKRRAAALVIMSIASGIALNLLLKHSFDRPRPELVAHATEVYTTSFPSGHSMTSAVTYLTLGVMLAGAQKLRWMKTYWVAWAIVLTVLVGLSRVYLGVHWPTDVLAGWSAGAAWALLWWIVGWWLAHRDKAGPETFGEEGEYGSIGAVAGPEGN